MKTDVKKAYIVAAIMSILLYSLGILTGFFVQKSTVDYTEERIDSLQRRVENLQLEYVYLNTLGERLSCDSTSILVDDATKEVWSIGRELVSLDRSSQKTKKFESLKRDYSLLSVRAWILNTYLNDKCKKNTAIVLYFYSVPCDECIEQGHILDALRENYFKENLTIFVLDSNIDEAIVQTLKKTYNINKTPAIVIGNSTYLGLIEKDRLQETISRNF